MDRSEVASIVRENLDRLRGQLGLGDWHIDVAYEHIGGETVGRVTVHSEYKRARIQIDHDRCDDEAEVLRVLRHELIHVFCWPMHAFGVHVFEMTDGASSDHFWTFALERLVRGVEELLDAHGAPLLPNDENEAPLTD